MGDVQAGAARPGWRGRLTDPAVPVFALVCATVAASFYAPLLTWAVIGGLAGYSLSGSV
ncbi:hypothetical protein [Streptomyces profundus]|uniref:hypothetical protein n=1 Tax=Streptomyces profundus TaxID=2867410 RepID=UPI001D1600DE|nr:hypothetical protein [Streptomyces sp. MA3_2.13]UED87824.1 hypothetical protein K4G22_29490 [Streptomyces sp. MA3_2.13]